MRRAIPSSPAAADAVLYLTGSEDVSQGRASVAGRPVAFRALMAALRAGCSAVAVPAAFRGTEVERAIDASPRARAATLWLADGESTPVRGPVLFVPATAIVPAEALRALLANGPVAVLAESPARAPIALLDPAAAATLVPEAAAERVITPRLGAMLGARQATAAHGSWCVLVTSERTRRDAERRLYTALGSAIDSPLDRLLHRPLSRLVTPVAVALGLTPNLVTVLSLFVGLGAAWCWARATLVGALLGLALYYVSVVLDHSDGEVARLTFGESRVGEWLDVVADTVTHAVGALAIGLAAERVGGGGLRLGLLAAVGFAASAIVVKTCRGPEGDQRAARALSALGTRDGFYALLLLVVLVLALAPGALRHLILLAALGSHAYWVSRLAMGLRHRRAGPRAARLAPSAVWSPSVSGGSAGAEATPRDGAPARPRRGTLSDEAPRADGQA